MALSQTLTAPRRRAWPSAIRVRRFATARLLDLLLLTLVVLMVSPIAFLIVNSFKTRAEVTTGVNLLPAVWQVDNYPDMWSRVNFGSYLLNSLLICSATTIVATFLAAMSGYALARFRFPGSDFFGLSILGTQFIPGVLFLIPLYLSFKWIRDNLGIPLTGSLLGGVVLYIGFFLPVSLWILRSFFAAIPPDLEEQAMVDGATRFQAFARIVLPLAMPGIVSTAVYIFLTSWDELVFAWVLNLQTVPVGIRLFTGVAGTQVRYELMSAAAVAVTLPVAVTFFLLQKRFISGLTAGAVK
jgi:multiple sugar transport system permease protein